MKTNIARVCQIGTTNYVEYKGERLTVEEHEAKHGVKLKIPKNIRVCEPEVKFMFGSESVCNVCEKRGCTCEERQFDGSWIPKHGSRAKLNCLYCMEKGIKADHKCLTAKEEINYAKLGDLSDKDFEELYDSTIAEAHETIEVPKNLRRVEEELPTTTSEGNSNHIGYRYKDGKWTCTLNGKELTKEEEESLWIQEKPPYFLALLIVLFLAGIIDSYLHSSFIIHSLQH